jgi:hypothetical protein
MTTQITARGELAHSPHAVFDFLADLRNHALLAPRWVKLRSRDLGTELPHQAIVRLHGPLAIRRTATTTIVDARAPALVTGRARIGERTRAAVPWTIAGRPNHSSVSLRVTVEETGFLDGMLLSLGAREWLQRRFADALACLADQLATTAAPNICAGESPALRPALQPAA